MTVAPTLTGCHLELHVGDLVAARDFYVGALGLPVLQDTPAIGLLAVRAGNVRVSIFGGAAGPAGVQRAHLVLATDDLAGTLAQLAARGVHADGPVAEAPGFGRYVALHDPDGHRVEIAQYLRDPLETL
ncbi:MAG: VOC family protein [Sphingopyxis sp.]|nr:VOC family protein [Sphingopyxis sp.]